MKRKLGIMAISALAAANLFTWGLTNPLSGARWAENAPGDCVNPPCECAKSPHQPAFCMAWIQGNCESDLDCIT